MSACQTVNVWTTEKVLVPIVSFITRAREVCQELRQQIEEQVSQPVENWISQQERRCRDLPWWNPVRWFCEIVSVVVKVVTWVVITVVKWVITIVCQIVTEVIGAIVTFVLRVIAWLVSFAVCLFTDPLDALKSFRDLWGIILDLVDDIFDIVKVLINDIAGILDDIDNLLGSLADSLGIVGAVIFGIFRGAVQIARDVVNIVRDFIEGIQNLVGGILGLNLCRILSGLSDIGIGAVMAIIRTGGGFIPLIIVRAAGNIVAGVRDSANLNRIEDIITDALNNAFPEDPERKERAIKRIGLGNRPMGLPFTSQPRRYFLSSRSSDIDLRVLHKEEIINLYELAGYFSGCKDALNRPRGEVVYAGTDLKVSYADLSRFLDEGVEAAPAFNVYPITKAVFTRYLYIARRKSQQLGIKLYWNSIDELPIEKPDQVQFMIANGGSGVQSLLEQQLARFGRTGNNDDLSQIPNLAVFNFSPNNFNGITSWFRPPLTDAKTGIAFKDRFPEFAFRWVLIHELGHYWGLNHHGGLESIMFTPNDSPTPVTPETVLEYLLLSGEPNFNLQDARDTWSWITKTASKSLLP